MGLSPAAGAGARDDPRPQPRAASTVARDVLIDLLGDVAGAHAEGLSDRLIARYRTPSRVLRTFAEVAHRDPSLPAPVDRRLRQVARAFLAAVSFDAIQGERLQSPDDLLAYLRYDMATLDREHFRVLFLDAGNRLLDDQTLWTGTIDAVQSHPREIVRIAIERSATALILVHNHPSGPARPSNGDMDATRRIVQACAGIDIIVHDHIIIGLDQAFSMRAAGLIADLERGGYAAR